MKKNAIQSKTDQQQETYASVVKTMFVKEGDIPYAKSFTTPKDAASIVRMIFEHVPREVLVVMSLATDNTPIAIETIGMGSINQCIVSIPDIFRHALLSCSSQIICFHNHISGNLKPSKEDLKITKRILKAGDLLDVKLIDHILIGNDGAYLSMAQEGIFEMLRREIKRSSEDGSFNHC